MRNYQITYKKLINNSILFFSINGYNGTSVRDIAYKTGIKESTFYHYFKSKKNLLLKLINIFESEINKLKMEQIKINNRYIYLKNKIIDLIKIINNENLNRIWRIINIETYSNDDNIIFKIIGIKRNIKNYIKNILSNLKVNNLIKSDNFELSTNDLYNNILFYFNEYSENKIKEKNTSEIEDNLYRFLKYYWEKIET
jgi:AcrR family transcriptional regulator